MNVTAHARDNVHGRREGASALKITEENCDIKASKHVEDTASKYKSQAYKTYQYIITGTKEGSVRIKSKVIVKA